MGGNTEHLVFGVCIALLLFFGFVGVASASTIYVSDNYANRFIHMNVSDSQIAQGALGYASARKLARTSDGVLHCVYEWSDGSYSQIWHAYSSDGGKTWAEEQIANSSSYNLRYPSIAIDSKDRIHVVWSLQDEPSYWGKKCTIQYRVKTTNWQPIENVITSYGSHPSIAIGSKDNVHLVLSGDWGGAYNCDDVKYLKRTSSGWSSVEKVSTQCWASAPAIAIDENENVHVAYHNAPLYGPYTGLRYRERTSSGWGSEVVFEANDGSGGECVPSIAVDSNNYVYVVWAWKNPNKDEWAIKFRRFTDSWQPTEILEGPTTYPQLSPTISVDSNDNLHVVWQGKHSGSPNYYQIRHRKYNGSWSAVENLTSASLDQRNPNLIWAWWPSVNNLRTHIPKSGYAFVWNDNTTIKFYKSTNLAWEGEGPSCKIELRRGRVKIDTIGVNEWFNIVITDYSGDIKKVRFLSDESQNGKVDEGFTWTDWYDWNTSKEDWTGHWYTSNKTKTWAFATPGEKEVWAEVEDSEGRTAYSHAGIYAIAPSAPPIAGKGIWIVNISKVEEKEGSLNNVINRLKGAKVSWVAIKCGDGRYFWSAERRATPERIEKFHDAGIKVLGWQVIYGVHGAGPVETGGDPEEEADVSNKIMNIEGIDGFIIDFEPREYYIGSAENATRYLELIREEHPKGKVFIAYAPYARVYKEDKPYYLNFSKYCDAVMPQAYWAMRPTDPETEIKRMEEGVEGKSEGWGSVYDKCTGEGIPIMPVGQGMKLESGKDVTGDEVRIFCENLYKKGYFGVSLFRYYYEGKIIKDEVWKAYRDCFNPQLTIIAHSPVDIAVIDPAGLIINKERNEIPGATYTEFDINGDGHPDDRITILYRKAGDYLINVTPEPDVSPTDTYTLEVSTETETTILAENTSISEIPSKPYVFTSTVIFDTGSPANPYPSIMGNHTGTIKPNNTVIVTKLYTYPCIGTGGHTEYVKIWNETGWNATATWDGYKGDWHNISFDKTVVLLANEPYNYTIRTGSYPQIIHEQNYTTVDGSFINCTKFTDANGKEYNNWIPAIRLWS